MSQPPSKRARLACRNGGNHLRPSKRLAGTGQSLGALFLAQRAMLALPFGHAAPSCFETQATVCRFGDPRAERGTRGSGTLQRMEGEGHIPADLSVSLRRPGEDRGGSQRGGRRKVDVESPAPKTEPEPEPATAGRSSTAPGQGAYGNLIRQLDDLSATLAAAMARMDSLADALFTHQRFFNERMADVGDTMSQTQIAFTRQLEMTLTRYQTETVQQLDKVLREARAEAGPDVDQGTTNPALPGTGPPAV